MADRSAHGFSWFVIGFLAGVAATLAVLIWSEGRSARRERAAEPVASAPPAPAPVKKPALARRREQEAPPSSAASPDEQVVEDAAAAGMTSRSHNQPGQ